MSDVAVTQNLIKGIADATLHALGHSDIHPILSDLGTDLWGRVNIRERTMWLNSRLLQESPWQITIMVVLHELCHVRANTGREGEAVDQQWQLMLRPAVLENVLREILERGLIVPPPAEDVGPMVGSAEQT